MGKGGQTDRQTNKHAHRHINTMTRLGLGAEPSEKLSILLYRLQNFDKAYKIIRICKKKKLYVWLNLSTLKQIPIYLVPMLPRNASMNLFVLTKKTEYEYEFISVNKKKVGIP